MSLSSLFDGLSLVKAALVGDLQGQLLDSIPAGSTSELQGLAEIAAVVAHELNATGEALGMGRLEMMAVKGPDQVAIAAFRDTRCLVAVVDPSRPAAAVEKILLAWSEDTTSPSPGAAESLVQATSPGEASFGARSPGSPPPAAPKVSPPPRPNSSSAAAPATEPPAAEPPAQAAQSNAPEPAAAESPALQAPPPAPAAETPELEAPPPAPAAEAPVPAAESAEPAVPADSPFALLRRAVVRGLLSDAASRVRQIAEGKHAVDQVGAEPLSSAALEQVASALLEGVGWVLGGDCVGGQRRLSEITAHQNRSFRWLALHWSARAALHSGDFAATLALSQAAVEVGEAIDAEAKAVSLWVCAEARAQGGQPSEGLRQLVEARKLFELHRDGWGLGQTWLAEAHIQAALGREPQSTSAALQALAVNSDWEGPRLFLARRALLRKDYDEAERTLRASRSSEAERERRLIRLIREGAVTPENAADFLRVRESPPNGAALRLLLKVARSSPRFPQAREVLAWMLLKLGKYGDAEAIFRGLLTFDLAPTDRASATLGLSCIANAAKAGPRLATPAASESAPPEAPPAPALSSSLVTGAAGRSGSGRLHTVFSGELSVFPLPDLLEFLRSGRRSGTLVCSCEAGMGTLHFIDGKITGAASPTTPVIGQILVAAHKLDEQALRATVAKQQSNHPDQPLGGLLVQEGVIEASAVRSALEQQIVRALREMVAWKSGQFAFDSKVVPERQRPEIEVEIDPQAIMLLFFKEMDEANRPARPLPEGDEL